MGKLTTDCYGDSCVMCLLMAKLVGTLWIWTQVLIQQFTVSVYAHSCFMVTQLGYQFHHTQKQLQTMNLSEDLTVGTQYVFWVESHCRKLPHLMQKWLCLTRIPFMILQIHYPTTACDTPVFLVNTGRESSKPSSDSTVCGLPDCFLQGGGDALPIS